MTKQDYKVISMIADRAFDLFRKIGAPRPKLAIMMDLEAVHESAGLRLVELLNADDENFGHDIFGIARHLNRESKELEDCFLPRFSTFA